METTTYILGTYDPHRAARYYDILNAFGVIRWDKNGNPGVVDTSEMRVEFPEKWRTFYTYKAEVYKRDVKVIRRLVKNTQYPSDYISYLRNFKEEA